MLRTISFCTSSVVFALVTMLVGCSGDNAAKPTTTSATEPAVSKKGVGSRSFYLCSVLRAERGL